MAKESINSDFFGIMLPDDIMIGEEPALSQLIQVAQIHNAIVIAVQEVPKESISAYGVIGIKIQLDDNLMHIDQLVEKPEADKAPSNLAIVGRYIVSSHIFSALEEIKPSKNGELQLTDALKLLLERGHKILAYKVQGNRFDVGTPAGWLQANMNLAMIKVS